MRAQKITIAALALAAGLSLTACQGDEDSASGKNDNAASSSSSSTGGSGDSESSGGDGGSSEGKEASTGGDESAGGDGSSATKGGEGSMGGGVNTGPCKTDNLDMRATNGMAEGTLVVTLKNTSDACSLKGFPGVDLKADSGPGGVSADRSELAAPSVVLQNGKETRFTLHYPRNDSGGSGVDITQLAVTPPNETHSKAVSIPAINIPVTDHSTSDVTVDPVGTGKQ